MVDAKVVASIIVAFLVVGIVGIHWEDYTGMDASRTALNKGTLDARKMLGASTLKQVPLDANNSAIVRYDVPNETVGNMAKTEDFNNAKEYSTQSGEPVAYRDANSGTSAVIAANDNLPSDSTAKSVLETGVSDKLPQNVPVKLSEVQRVTSETTPRYVSVDAAPSGGIIVPSNLTDYQIGNLLKNSPSFLSALGDAASRAGKGLLAFTIGSGSNAKVGLIPWGFTTQEAQSLAGNGAVKDTVSLTPKELGMTGSQQSVQDTQAYKDAKVDVPSLPANPGMSLNVPKLSASGLLSGPLSFLSGIVSFILGLIWGLVKWLLVIALVFVALLFGVRYLKDHRHALKKAEPAASIKELEYDRNRPGSAAIKGVSQGSNVINLSPLFRVKVVDNLVSRTSPALQLTLENVSGEDVSDARLSSPSGIVTVFGDVGAGDSVEGKTVRLGAKDVPGASVELSLDFDTVKVGERSFSNFSFRVPLRRVRLAAEGGKYCWKHPDREASVHCDDCGRGLCPDCTFLVEGRVHCSECTGGEEEGIAKEK